MMLKQSDNDDKGTLFINYRTFTEKQLHKVRRMSLTSNEYFGGRGLHPLQPNAISPSGSVMTI